MRKRKEQLIINAAIDLFAAYGIRNVPIEKIADKLKISRGQIYYYFKGGRSDIIAAILQLFEELVSSNIPSPKEWEAVDADAAYILSTLFFKFSDTDAQRHRKIIRIFLSEMFFNEQIKEYVEKRFVFGRENMLASCFESLAKNKKIKSFPTDSAARYLNRLLVVYAILDALQYSNDMNTLYEAFALMERDCMSFLNLLLN